VKPKHFSVSSVVPGVTRPHSRSSEENEEYVGLLPKSLREEKVQAYLQKKMNRSWNRKINYHSRKRVADTRPRIKGRFVSVNEAGPLLLQYKQE